MLKSLITTLLTFGLLAPSATYASSFVESIIESARAGNGTVVESHASASTGGQRAGSGETVTTGDVSASSVIETHINSGSKGGEVKVKIETSQNGVTHTDEYTKPIAPGENVNVHIATSSKATPQTAPKAQPAASAATRPNSAEIIEASTSATTTPTPPAPMILQSSSSLKSFFSVKIPAVFKKVFGFFWVF